MIKYEYGNMLNIPCDAIVITTNGFVKANGECVMGRGIAKNIADAVPQVPSILGNKILTEGNRVHYLGYHRTHLVSFPVKPVSKIMTTPSDAVGHMQSKISIGQSIPGWACKADIKIIEESLHQLKAGVDGLDWERILIPYLGCGAGELNWSDIKPLVEDILDKRFIAVTFKPTDH